MLYQSTSSDTCGVCAIGNLLSLYGITGTRAEIAQLLTGERKLESNSVVTRPALMGAVATYFPSFPLHWKRIPRFSFARLSSAVSEAFGRGAPVLVSLHVKHRQRNWYGLHVAVAINNEKSGIGIIDSLGRRNGVIPNATITQAMCTSGWIVAGAPVVITRESAFILQGLPKLSNSKRARP